jgi:hypothetical protein
MFGEFGVRGKVESSEEGELTEGVGGMMSVMAMCEEI